MILRELVPHPRLTERAPRRARCEDRICNSKDTGLNNLPDAFAQNQVWIAVMQLAT